jgi:hypothetical protein
MTDEQIIKRVDSVAAELLARLDLLELRLVAEFRKWTVKLGAPGYRRRP